MIWAFACLGSVSKRKSTDSSETHTDLERQLDNWTDGKLVQRHPFLSRCKCAHRNRIIGWHLTTHFFVSLLKRNLGLYCRYWFFFRSRGWPQSGLQNVRNPASTACRQGPNFVGRKGSREKRKRKKREKKEEKRKTRKEKERENRREKRKNEKKKMKKERDE